MAIATQEELAATDGEPLARLVERQRRENDGLRAALRDRAVVKGGRTSGRHSAVAAAPDFNELIPTVVQPTADLGVTAGMLALAEPDGALRLVAWHGVETHTVSSWQRIPPGTDLPLCAAAERREPVWLRDRDERRRRFPGSSRFPGHREASAAVPPTLDQKLLGCLGLEWDRPLDVDDGARTHLTTVAELCAAPIAALLHRHDDPLPELDLEPGYARWFRALLDSLPAPTILLEPVEHGRRLTDLMVCFVNRAAGNPGPLGLDCSGYVRMLFGVRFGVPMSLRPDGGGSLPRRSFEQAADAPGVVPVPDTDGQATDHDRLQPGDLVFFDAPSDDDGRIDHVGVYLGIDDAGHHRFVHSRRSSNGPTMGGDDNGPSVLDGDGYFARGFRATRRF